jgi:SAM-dependent methyltransferase
MTWTQVDEGWGRKAVDYAYLIEAQMWPEYVTLLDACGVEDGTRLLDVACGPAYALAIARDRGAVVSGIDASPRLVKVALARTPEGDIRVGDMFELPWPDASFDVVTSFRGIWGGCEDALAEAVRVCRPGGRVGLSFWGNPKRMAAYPLFKLFGQVQDHDYAHAKEMSNIAWEGVAEQMMRDAGLEPGTRWMKSVPLAFPDPELAVRAFSSSGPAYLAISTMGEEAFSDAAREAAEQLSVPDAGVRFGFEVQFLVGEKPG